MTIPCETCGRKSECIRDGHCNRPATMAAAIKEAREAVEAVAVATRRLNEAMAQLAAAVAIERGKQKWD